MEKRFVVFVILCALILTGYFALQQAFAPPQPQDQQAEDAGQLAGEVEADQAGNGAGSPVTPEQPPSVDVAKLPDTKEPAGGQAEAVVAASTTPAVPRQRGALGSMAPDSPYRLLVVWNNQGAAIERIELTARDAAGRLRYESFDEQGGYLGPLGVSSDDGGVRVTVVGPGTPAANADCVEGDATPGLLAGDLITRLDDRLIVDAIDWQMAIATTRPGQTVQIAVVRASGGSTAPLTFSATLQRHPLAIIQPELMDRAIPDVSVPLSCLLGLQIVGKAKAERGQLEVAGLPSLREQTWAVRQLAGDEPGVEFRLQLTSQDLKRVGVQGELEVVKRFRLARVAGDQLSNEAYPAYHLTLEIEFSNRGSEPLMLAHSVDGPNGLPLEGWWYSTKINPRSFSSVGARDVAWATQDGGIRLYGPSAIVKKAEDEPGSPNTILIDKSQPQGLRYVGVDTKYFAAVLQADPADEKPSLDYPEAVAFPLGNFTNLSKAELRTANVGTRLLSAPYEIPAGKSRTEKLILFAGPKQPELLAEYRSADLIVYGYSIFEFFAKLLSSVLHFFESLPGVNYGLAIILLTVLVRGLMFPISRKAAKNAQMMQQLGPEMKAIAEKYKTDMEKRGQAQRELFRKHNYNPFGGCLLMFLQLPVFIGLYKCLSVDIELRQAALIPGVEWCSNLAAPDMLFRFPDGVFDFIRGEASGWLGPYFNILPCFTIALFIVQQKLFTPPATDEQTRMTQKMMNYMMVFMGVMFFKVPSGLCIYFIASSLWGIAERTLLPKPSVSIASTAVAPTAPDEKRGLLASFRAKTETNGKSAKDRAKARRKRRK